MAKGLLGEPRNVERRFPLTVMRHLVAVLCLAAAACGQSGAPRSEAPRLDPRAAGQIGDVRQLQHPLPPVGDTPRYIGAWSTTGGRCTEPAWIINAETMHTQGEVSCTFNDVNEIPGGYAIDATCTAEAPPQPYHMQFTFAEAAQAMLITGGPWSPSPSLIHCGGPL